MISHIMNPRRIGALLALAVGLALPAGAAAQGQAGSDRTVRKGGDERTGAYDVVPNWWKRAADHDSTWTWGQVSGLAVDNPNRILVAVWGDRDRQGRERPNSSNYLVVVDRNGNLVENWSHWDSIFNKPHQVYISPYDPERHIWIVERGEGEANMEVFKFTNDGKRLVMRLGDRDDASSRAEARLKADPGPYDYGDPAVLAFFPNGDFLLGDGYWNGRIIRYNAKGEFLSKWGSVGSGPGQFDLIHGLAIDRDHRVYVGDRSNNRVQVFTEDGTFIEEWPDIYDPVGIVIDENDAVWVVSARLNRILKYNLAGELQYYFGAFGMTAGIWQGGLARPHQLGVGDDGSIYIANFDGGWVNKFVPKPGADPSKLIGRPLVLTK